MTIVKGEYRKDNIHIRRALISVYNKEGVVELAKALVKNGVEIISTGGSAQVLNAAGIEIRAIESITQNPEAFSGRMKSISFQVASGILFRRFDQEDLEQAKTLNIEPIDLVVCNLYPFEDVLEKGGSFEELVENIDIGGPNMLRAAAKNMEGVCALSDPLDYQIFLREFLESGQVSFELRKMMALKTFKRSALYDGIISQALGQLENIPGALLLDREAAQELRYGENPHQSGSLCVEGRGVASARILQGKAMSFNNFVDADAAYSTLNDLDSTKSVAHPFACVVIKHANPCGAALGDSLLDSLTLAWNGDPVSSFGSIICFNHSVDEKVAHWLKDKFVEVIMAPEFSSAALGIFGEKKNLRIAQVELGHVPQIRYKNISGGTLFQQSDQVVEQEYSNVTKASFPENSEELINFGVVVTKHLKSNAIALVKKFDHGMALVGAGMGNPNRLVSTEQAISKARENGIEDFSELILLSDAFFPFADNVELADRHGIKKIIQPGGSIRDAEVIQACDRFGMAMALTGIRHFSH